MHRLMMNETTLMLYGDVGDMWGDGSGFKDKEVVEALTEMEGDITVAVNSGGGIVFEGIAIYNAIKAYEGEVTVTVDGVAASAASLIAMAGDKVVMREGSQMMIHDPSALTIGNAEDHTKTADLLNRLGDTSAKIYSSKTGKPVEEVRAAMLAETWFDASEAVEFGLATEENEAVAEPVAAFDWSIYNHVPASIRAANQRALPKTDKPKVATATSSEGNAKMPTDKVVAAEEIATKSAYAVEPVMKAEPKPVKNYDREIMALCKDRGLAHMAVDIVEQADGDMSAAKDLIIDHLMSADPSPVQATLPARIEMGADQRDKFFQGAKTGLMARLGMEGGERNEYSGLTLKELARESLKINNVSEISHDPMTMAGQALGIRMDVGRHSTSDFKSILADVANKSMLIGYEETEETHTRWTSTGSLSDFKTVKRVDLNLFPALSEVPEGAEYSMGTLSDRESEIALATYGKLFAVTRQAIINDDLSVMTRVPRKMGRAASRTVGNLVWSLMLSNPVMQDGNNLFDNANHGNLASSGAAPSVATFDAARVAMGLQKDPESIATALNIRPQYVLVPYALEGETRVLLGTEFDPSQTQRVPNSVRGMVEVVPEARLDADSSTAWYMVASPTLIDTLEVAYLNGNSSPVMEERDGWNVDGVEFKIRLDCGVAIHDFRGFYKDPGA